MFFQCAVSRHAIGALDRSTSWAGKLHPLDFNYRPNLLFVNGDPPMPSGGTFSYITGLGLLQAGRMFSNRQAFFLRGTWRRFLMAGASSISHTQITRPLASLTQAL